MLWFRAALARWSRITLVRELSSAAAAEGGALGSKFGSKFARQARESAAERQKRYQQKCQIIFDRQVLRGSAAVCVRRRVSNRSRICLCLGWPFGSRAAGCQMSMMRHSG